MNWLTRKFLTLGELFMRDVPLVHLHTELVRVSPELGCHGVQRARIVRIGQKRPNRKKCRAHVIDRRPFVLQNVEADRSVLIDVRVKDRRSEDDGRRAVRVVRRERDRACTFFPRTPTRPVLE